MEGPQVRLLASDVAGVFPAPDSDTSPDEFLPHIALTRRTLPWDRPGPVAGAPWLALLLLRQGELGRRSAEGGAGPVVPTTVGALKSSRKAPAP